MDEPFRKEGCDVKAKVQARVFSAPKTVLENVVPLRTPFSVHIDVCSVCNFRCKFCFQADVEAIKKKGLTRGFMTFELFKKIADDLTAFPDKMKKVKIGLHGEPTMHPRLPEMIAYVKSKNVTEELEMFTNGSLLNPTLSQAIIDAGLTRINVSVEAIDRERYKLITGTDVDMEKFVANVRDLYERRGNCKIYVKIVDANLDEQDKAKFYETFGDISDEIFIEHVVPQWADTNRFDLDATGMYGQPIKKHKYVCPFLFMYLHFNYDGTTSGCTLDWGKEVLIGDVSKESALEIWNGEKLKALQIMHLEKKRDQVPFCDKCLAPMVCCMEDLDDHTEELLKKIRG